MHAVATSRDDLFLELPLGTLRKGPERLLQREDKNVFTVHRSPPGKTLPRFHSKEFAQSDEFARFAFNLLMCPDDHATKKNTSSPRCEFFTQSR